MTIHLLAKRLRSLRESLKLTQVEFALFAMVGGKKYQRLESGTTQQVRLSQVEKLAEAHGLAAWQLIHPTEPRSQVTRADVKMAKELAKSIRPRSRARR